MESEPVHVPVEPNNNVAVGAASSFMLSPVPLVSDAEQVRHRSLCACSGDRSVWWEQQQQQQTRCIVRVRGSVSVACLVLQLNSCVWLSVVAAGLCSCCRSR